MPQKKNYPKWFNKHCAPYKPYKPTTPQKLIDSPLCIKNIDISGGYYSKEDCIGIIPQEDFDYVEISIDYDDGPHILRFMKNIPSDNTNYPAQVKQHKKDMEKYHQEYEVWKTRNKEWKALKARWEKEEEEELRAREQKEYERLKKKFSKDSKNE